MRKLRWPARGLAVLGAAASLLALAQVAQAQVAAAEPLTASTAVRAATPGNSSSLVTSPATAPANPAADAIGPELSARFRVTWTPRSGPTQVQQWQLKRTATEISWIKSPTLEEIWRLDRSGIRLDRVLRADRHVISYSAGELRTLAVTLDWSALGSLIAEPDLAHLHAAAGSPADLTRGTQRYRGVLGADTVDLRWDPVARLPVQLLRRNKTGQVLYQRLTQHRTAPADWPRAGAGTEDFQRVDAADFGDMDYKPVVRQEQARDERAGWRAPHSH